MSAVLATTFVRLVTAALRGLPGGAHPARLVVRALAGLLVWGCCLAGLLSPAALAAADHANDDPTRQSADHPWQLQSLASDTALERQRVFDLAFQPDGTAWVAASNGLWRHDGYGWTRFGVEHGLPGNFVRALLWSRENELWVGTDRGIGVYDPATHRFDPRDTAQHLPNQNARRIAQDPDGTLWFCCDRWPDPTVPPGGLASLRDGKWTVHDASRGIVRDAVINYHRTRDGRRLALTTNQWFESAGDAWTLNPGSDLEPIARHVAESADGRIFVQGEKRLLVSDPGAAGGWRVLADDTLIVGSVRDGQVFALRHDRARGTVWFERWDGEEFVPASSWIADSPESRFHRMVEAPDGALWCVGNGAVLRWDRGLGPWRHHPALPWPVLQDARGRTWFADGASVFWREAGVFHRLDGLARFHGVDADGAVVGERADGSLVVLASPRDPVDAAPGTPPPGWVQLVCADRDGRLWLLGRHAESDTIFALRREGAGWTRASLAGLDAPEFTSAQPAPDGGVFFVAVNRDTKAYHVLHAAPDGSLRPVSLGDSPPALTFPHYSRVGDAEFVHAYLGLYQRIPAGRGEWTRAPLLDDALVQDFSARRDAAIWLFQSRQYGSPQTALFAGGRWSLVPQDYEHVLPVPGRDGFALVRRGVVRRQIAPDSTVADFIPLPERVLVHGVVQDADGALWMGTPEGVFRHDRRAHPPRTFIHAPVHLVRRDQTLPLSFWAAPRFEAVPPAAAFRYSHRVDGGAWSDFLDEAHLELPAASLAPGPHRVEVRALDADGNIDLAGAALDFEVAGIPLQERPFFPYLVGAIMLVIAALAWLGHSRARLALRTNRALAREIEEHEQTETELHATNDQLLLARSELELRVEERTAELTAANAALRASIEAREQAALRQASLEQQLREAQKMEAIGTLAGGIAHDINNILTVIIPCASFARDAAPPRSPAREYLEQLLRAADRAKNLVKQILTFSRRQKPERKIVDLAPLIDETLRLLRSALPATIRISTRIAPGAPPVFADPHQIHQVLMNLCTNSQHALPDQRGDIVIHLETRRIAPGLPADADPAGPPPGDYVVLGVEDNGAGMDEAHQARIFEPFFTTKVPGQGTGLGLAVVHGIVRDHEGVIRLRSAPGRGARFDIFLPARRDPAAPASASPLPADPAHRRRERVLAIDDEPEVLSVVRLSLERQGFEVDAFGDPARALTAFREDPSRHHVVVTDLTMPGLTGLDLARALLALRPGLPVLLVTGVGDAAAIASARAAGVRRLLPKPFSPDELVAAVRDVLDARPGE